MTSKNDFRLKPLWKEATQKLILKLEKNNINFKKFNALDIFGRNGKWQTTMFADKVNSLEVWEIDQQWEKELENNLKNAKIRILDSIKNLEKSDKLPKFDLILIDNPMNLFGPIDLETKLPRYCEHFEVMKNIKKIMNNEVIIIFNVNREPFDYKKFPHWKKRRDLFYQINSTDNISIKFLSEFYKKYFKKIGFKTKILETEVRVFYDKIDMTYYFAMKLVKI
jgi:hypothetical protein